MDYEVGTEHVYHENGMACFNGDGQSRIAPFAIAMEKEMGLDCISVLTVHNFFLKYHVQMRMFFFE
jgi:hypothetical protein